MTGMGFIPGGKEGLEGLECWERDFIPAAPTSAELREIPTDPNHFLRKKDKSTNPCAAPSAPNREFHPLIQQSQRSSSSAPSNPTSISCPGDPEFPPWDPQESREVQTLTPVMEEMRSEAKIPKFLTRNGHSRKIPGLIDPGLCSHSKFTPESLLPINSPWEYAALSKLPQVFPISGGGSFPGKTSQTRNRCQSRRNSGICSPG